jgi:hypothetical protein
LTVAWELPEARTFSIFSMMDSYVYEGIKRI